MALRSDLYENELVAVKDGRPGDALRREAALLADLAHPGIIRFVALTGDTGALRLLTRYAGRETLATWRPNRADELARVFADLAEAVHYLHAQGVVHGSIGPAHVVIDAQRRPLLCGFSEARRGRESDLAAEQLVDVAAVGTTLLHVLDTAEAGWPRSSRRRDDQRLVERLRIAAQAAADGRVPSAKALAGQISTHRSDGDAQNPAGTDQSDCGGSSRSIPRPGEASARPGPRRWAPLQRLAGRPGPGGIDPRAALRRAHRGRRRPRRATVLATAVVCAGCALGALMVTRLDGDRAASPAAGTGPLDGSATLTANRSAGPPAPAGVASHPEAVAAAPWSAPPAPDDDVADCRPPVAGYRDITGDGCAEEVIIDSGAVLIGGVRYPVGEAGDQVAVGDWDCDGVATVALVQDGGRVYVFDGWPEGAALVGELLVDLTPPVRLADVARGACNELVVHYAGGTWHLPLPASSS
jgi:hypothetical protein